MIKSDKTFIMLQKISISNELCSLKNPEESFSQKYEAIQQFQH